MFAVRPPPFTSMNLHTQSLFEKKHEIDAMLGVTASSPYVPEDIPCDEVSSAEHLVESPVVSVQIITYNHAAYIRRTLDSILSQKCPFPFEVVIGEDCSTDQTRAICLEYQRNHPDVVRILVSEKNVGALANSLRTLVRCRGKFIACCEGDDFWPRTDKLALQAAYLESHPEAGLVHANAGKLNPETGRQGAGILDRFEAAIAASTDPVHELLRREWIVITCTAMLRREVLLECIREHPGLYCVNRLVGDVLWWVGCVAKSKFGYINQQLGVKVLAPASASRSPSLRQRIRFNWEVFTAHVELNDVFGGSDPETREVIFGVYANSLFKMAYELGDRRLAGAFLGLGRTESLAPSTANRFWQALWRLGIPFTLAARLSRILHGLRRLRPARKLASTLPGLRGASHG